MSRSIKSLSQSFISHKGKGWAIAAYWSSDWKTRKPYTYGGQPVAYVDKRSQTGERGRMTCWFIGPLLVIYFR